MLLNEIIIILKCCIIFICISYLPILCLLLIIISCFDYSCNYCLIDILLFYLWRVLIIFILCKIELLLIGLSLLEIWGILLNIEYDVIIILLFLFGLLIIIIGIFCIFGNSLIIGFIIDSDFI